MTATLKFNRYNVTNGTTTARVHYSLNGRTDGRQCVTIYAKDYDRKLGELMGDAYENQTDSMTDYFDKGCVRLFPDHPHYAAARFRAENPTAPATPTPRAKAPAKATSAPAQAPLIETTPTPAPVAVGPAPAELAALLKEAQSVGFIIAHSSLSNRINAALASFT